MNEITKKIAPLPPPDHHARLVEALNRALDDADAVGHDIADAIANLIKQTSQRALESLPDITQLAEAA